MTSESSRAAGPGATNSMPAIIGISCRLPSASDVASYWGQVTGLADPTSDPSSSTDFDPHISDRSIASPTSRGRSTLTTAAIDKRNEAALALSNACVTAASLAKKALLNAAVSPWDHADARIAVACRNPLTSEQEDRLTESLRADMPHCIVSFHPAFSAALQSVAQGINDGEIPLAVAIALETEFGAALVMTPQDSPCATDITRIYGTIAGVEELSGASAGAGLVPASLLQQDFDATAVSLLECVSSGGDDVVSRATRHYEGRLGPAKIMDARAIDLLSESSSLPGTLAEAAATIKAVLALYHRTLPPTTVAYQPLTPWHANDKARTWIHPKIHPKVPTEVVDVLDFKAHPRRRAAVFTTLPDGGAYNLTLEEFDDPRENERTSLQTDWDSELIVLSGDNMSVLMRKLEALEAYIYQNPQAKLRNIASTLSRESSFPGLHLSIVSACTSDLMEKVMIAKEQLSAPYSVPAPSTTGVYLPCDDLVRAGKTAFILPGLGAAYPNMLAELALHFPDVRAVFDFVDQLALSAGETLRPSKLIFPWPANAQNTPASTAILASMDSAVITVLMAEWALFTMLSNLGIKPDILIGCSTGEFAALTMSGATDIVTAAPMFYKLSTTIARSVSKSSLANLRSIKVNANFADVEPLLAGLSEIYLSADLSSAQHLISGARESVNEAGKRLDAAGIEFFQLPMAIPYHTPLVAGVIDANNAELKQLALVAPTVPTWSCSSASPYPHNVDKIRQITTELFTRPILLQQTVEQAYWQGVTKFIEVGPKGTLTPVLAEILAGRPHLAVASNLATGSSITQLNHMMAALASADVELSLIDLFLRRQSEFLDDLYMAIYSCSTASGVPAVQSVHNDEVLLDGKDADIADAPADALSFAPPVLETQQSSNLRRDPGVAEVVNGYLCGMAAFYDHLMQVQGDVMSAFLQSPRSDHRQADGTSDLEFVKRGMLSFAPADGKVELNLNLSLDQHKYLLDHAVGGAVSSQEGVNLLPLTVAIEIMAETAALLMPGLAPVKFENICAAKRIRVRRNGCQLRVAATIDRRNAQAVRVEIFSDHSIASTASAMSCQVIFSHDYCPAPQDQPAIAIQRSSRLPAGQLYGPQTMFHGPLLQSIAAIESVGEKTIAARAQIRPATGWFGSEIQAPKFLCDPLLLDNATQAVLFYLFEDEQNVCALLPFFIDSLELFQDLSAAQGTARVTVDILANSTTGTESDITIAKPGEQVIARFNRLCHRRVTLSDGWRSLVAQTDQTFLTTEMTALTAALPHAAMWSTALVREKDAPVDDAILFWCADYLLSASEHEFFSALPNARRQREWLLGRIALKDAVRRLAGAHGVAPICPADVETQQQDDGRPAIGSRTVNLLGWQPIVSLSHKGGVAVAIAGHPDAATAVGIDVETIEPREEGFEQLALTHSECARLIGIAAPRKQIAITQMWCAKEAVGKALGMGLSNNPLSLETGATEAEQSTPVLVRRTSDSTAEFQAHILSENNLVFAVSAID